MQEISNIKRYLRIVSRLSEAGNKEIMTFYLYLTLEKFPPLKRRLSSFLFYLQNMTL